MPQPRSLAGSALAPTLAVVLTGSGLLQLSILLHAPGGLRPPGWLRTLFPLGLGTGAPPPAQLLVGFALILAGFHLWARKKRALHMAVCLAAASSIFLWRSESMGRSAACLLIAITLIKLRRQFPIGSDRPSFAFALRRVATALAVALLYGTIGFWLVEPRHFGQNFHWWQAAAQTMRAILLLGDTGLDPLTPHAQRFLESLFWMSAAMFSYCGLLLFKPAAYHFRDNLAERYRARDITARYGRTAQDFFKHWPDKSFFFSSSGQSFLAYRVASGFALTLGDPVGPEEEAASTIRQFTAMCRLHGWKPAFHQVRGDRLPIYEQLGFRGLKIGDEAVVDLTRFSLEGSAMKEARNTVTRLKRAGYHVDFFDAPLNDALLDQLERVSSEWLSLPGHRERRFTLGAFSRDYVRGTSVYVAFDASGKAAAFLNLIPSYDAALATVDLMRRGHDTANGLMDFVFAQAFLDSKRRGYQRFSLGLAPLAEFSAQDHPSAEEKAVQWGLRRLPQLFRADSLRRFKSKYASNWEPRYEVYGSRWDLPRLAFALRNVTETHGRVA